MAPEQLSTDVAGYCRQLETYLCQKNEGHLIRIVGPSFDQVCSWAERGVPLKVAFRGIDRYCERYYAKGDRRRPVRIEFCEADILDVFDEWRRAVGLVAGRGAVGAQEASGSSRRPSLASHIERALGRLRPAIASASVSGELPALIEGTIRELESLSQDANASRGEKRLRITERLASLDEELIAAALRHLDAARAAELKREVEAELAPFGSRLTPDVREKASAAAFHRLVREAYALPTLAYE
jgi:hypothetical protein